MIEALLQAERLLVHGMVDQAEQIYLRTLESDPHNAIAEVGLARVALERGDDRLAYAQACAALEIDQRNPAALRLEARLSEVLAARGEEVARPSWLAGLRGTEPPRDPVPRRDPEPPRESEQVALTRNPSMADHLQRMNRPPESTSAPANRPTRPKRRPRGILRRLLGG